MARNIWTACPPYGAMCMGTGFRNWTKPSDASWIELHIRHFSDWGMSQPPYWLAGWLSGRRQDFPAFFIPTMGPPQWKWPSKWHFNFGGSNPNPGRAKPSFYLSAGPIMVTRWAT